MNEIIIKINNMDGIEYYSCEVLNPVKKWDIWSQQRSYIPVGVQYIIFLKPDEETIKTFKDFKNPRIVFYKENCCTLNNRTYKCYNNLRARVI